MAEQENTPPGEQDINELIAALDQLSPAAGGAAPGAQPISLGAMIDGALVDILGPRVARGFSPIGSMLTLPAWARNLPAEIRSHPDFDPYFADMATPEDDRVFWGTAEREIVQEPERRFTQDGRTELPPRLSKKEPETVTEDETLSLAQIQNMPYLWDEDEINDAMKRMREAGFNVQSFDIGDSSLVKVWGALTSRAAAMYGASAGDRKVTPWDVLGIYKKEAQAAGTLTDYENGTKTTVTKSVTDISEGEAWSTLQTSLSQMLGRSPDDQEVRDFAYRASQLAAANPSITETISRFKAGDMVGQDVSTTGGFSGADLQKAAVEEAQADGEYAEFQSASTYFNAALSALGAIGS